MVGEVAQSAPVLQVCSLTKGFAGFVAVDDVSFEVERGSFVSLLGPSGSGKTTILRVIAGFETPSAGDILLGGERINEKRPYQRDVATVFQQYALFPHMSVFDNIAFGLHCRRLPALEVQERVGRILELTQLCGKAQRRIQTLSGGEQQRVALARSLVTNPSLLLLDEPLGALDLKLRREMATELKRLHQRLNMTFLYVTHDQEEALSMSDKVIVLHAGRIRQAGTPTELYWHPRTRFVADFLGGANVLTGPVIDCREGVVRVAIGKGPEQAVVAVACDGEAKGSHIAFAVRGEKIAVGSEADTKDNSLTGVLDDIRFYGSLTELDVRLSSGQSLRIRRGPGADAYRDLLGREIRVGWNANEAVTVKQD